jgi:hypothetical protein
METWKHGDIDMETWKHREMETWKHGDIETWTWRHGHGDMDFEKWTWSHGHGDLDMETWTWRHGHRDMETSDEAQAISLVRLPFAHHTNRSLSFFRLLTKKQMEVLVFKQTNKTKWTK